MQEHFITSSDVLCCFKNIFFRFLESLNGVQLISMILLSDGSSANWWTLFYLNLWHFLIAITIIIAAEMTAEPSQVIEISWVMLSLPLRSSCCCCSKYSSLYATKSKLGLFSKTNIFLVSYSSNLMFKLISTAIVLIVNSDN